jgi:hypothetical protein
MAGSHRCAGHRDSLPHCLQSLSSVGGHLTRQRHYFNNASKARVGFDNVNFMLKFGLRTEPRDLLATLMLHPTVSQQMRTTYAPASAGRLSLENSYIGGSLRTPFANRLLNPNAR